MSFEQDITFAADGTLTGHTRFVWTTSDLTDTPGCTDDFTSTTPQTWSTAAVDGGLYLTVEGSADPIEALSDCPDPSNDRDAGATSGHLSGIPTWPPSGPYMLSADHNTLTAGTGRTTITYVRQ